MTEEQIKDAGYYRACAAEMMVKAQAAPSKGTRRAYLNLALKWQALENQNLPRRTGQPSPMAGQ